MRCRRRQWQRHRAQHAPPEEATPRPCGWTHHRCRARSRTHRPCRSRTSRSPPPRRRRCREEPPRRVSPGQRLSGGNGHAASLASWRLRQALEDPAGQPRSARRMSVWPLPQLRPALCQAAPAPRHEAPRCRTAPARRCARRFLPADRAPSPAFRPRRAPCRPCPPTDRSGHSNRGVRLPVSGRTHHSRRHEAPGLRRADFPVRNSG